MGEVIPCDLCACEALYATAGLIVCEIHARMIVGGQVEIENQEARESLRELLACFDN